MPVYIAQTKDKNKQLYNCLSAHKRICDGDRKAAYIPGWNFQPHFAVYSFAYTILVKSLQKHRYSNIAHWTETITSNTCDSFFDDDDKLAHFCDHIKIDTLATNAVGR